MSNKPLTVSSQQLTSNIRNELRGLWILGVTVSCLLLTVNGAHAQDTACNLTREVGGVTVERAIRALPPDGDEAPDPSTFSCQNVPGGISSARTSCVSGGCPQFTAATVLCCAPGTGGAPATAGAAPSGEGTPAPRASGGGRLQLPSCIEDGNCGLEDIVRTGVNFANFLFGISGAIFLAIFVYSGVEYLIFASNSSKVQAAKKRLVDASVGIFFIIAAGALTTFVYEAFITTGGGGGGGEDRCASSNPGYVCRTLPGSGDELNSAIEREGCRRGFCPGGDNNVCCPSGEAGTSGGGGGGTCRCAVIAGGLIGGLVSDDQRAEGAAACSDYGGTFNASDLSCVGPATESECGAAGAAMPDGVTCDWSP